MLLLTGCQTNQDVVSNGLLQKRKHRPGFHLNWKKQVKHKQEATEGSNHQWASSDSIRQPADTTKRSDDRIHPIKRLLADHHASSKNIPLPSSNIASPKIFKRPSLRAQADERSEELEELLDHKVRNERNLKITGILSALSIVATIAYYVTLVLGVPVAPFIGLVVFPLSVISRYALPLFIIYLIEYFKLKKDELFFNQKRIMFFEDATLAMKRVQLITFITSLLSVIGFIAGLIFSPPVAILSVLTFGISIFIFGLASWVGIVAGLAVKRFSQDARRSLVQLIIIQILGNLLTLLMFILFILLLFGAFTGGIII